jgi:UDP-glucuronate decarboxylase
VKVLITGGAGFLGSHLTRLNLHAGNEVIVLDDFSTGSISNLSEFKKSERLQIIKHDVRDPIDLDVDQILNFACPASPVHYQFDPVKTIETNFLGMKNMLTLAKNRGARILQASTSEVYGDPEINPQREEYWGNVNPIGIRSCYDEGKRSAETLCFDYKRQHGLDVRVIRIFNTYGPNMAVNDGRVVSNFIVQALKGEDITIYGDGTQTRSFCYVDDLVAGIDAVMQKSMNPKTPINLGNVNEFTMLELARLVLRVSNSNSKIDFRTLPSDDPRQRKPDTTKARDYYDWEARVPLEQGIMQTIEYFKRILV